MCFYLLLSVSFLQLLFSTVDVVAVVVVVDEVVLVVVVVLLLLLLLLVVVVFVVVVVRCLLFVICCCTCCFFFWSWRFAFGMGGFEVILGEDTNLAVRRLSLSHMPLTMPT